MDITSKKKYEVHWYKLKEKESLMRAIKKAIITKKNAQKTALKKALLPKTTKLEVPNKEELEQNILLANKLLVKMEKASLFIEFLHEKIDKMQIEIDGFIKLYTDLKQKCEYLDETLCNVLLAIRQNEYLQAWYPAQNGKKEVKVVGRYVDCI